MTDEIKRPRDRRTTGYWAAGSDAPELNELKVGFIPLTDCAPVIVAARLGFDRRYGIRIRPSREASWAALRDKLLGGALDAAHMLYGLVYGVQLGISGPRRDMAVLMTLNQNGQGITLSAGLRAQGVTSGESLRQRIVAGAQPHAFAHTFPTGTHAMWLYYWLAAHDIDPFTAVNTLTVPPPQMVRRLAAGAMDGYCAGEPWNARAVADGIGYTVATSQAIWPEHPDKVLATTREFARRNPHTARALIMALLDAARYIDTLPERSGIAALLAEPDCIATDVGTIAGRLNGDYSDNQGGYRRDPHAVKFHADGAVNFPYLSDAMWFMTQHRRWGLLSADPDYRGIASAVNQTALYSEAATVLGVPLPSSPLRHSTLLDGKTWTGDDPAGYAAAFAIAHRQHRTAALA